MRISKRSFPVSSAFAVFLALLAMRASFAGGELRELYRGARATAMGNAYVGLADDEQSLFLNPAGMAGIKGYQLRYFSAGLELPGDALGTISALSNVGGGSGSLNAIMGKNIYLHGQITPTFVMPNFGIGLIVDQQTAIYAKNIALPHITMGYQTTNGVQAAYGISLLPKSRRGNSGELRFGVGAKVLWRRGGYHQLTLTELFGQVGSPSLQTLQSTVTGEFGRGYGVDAGLQYVKTLSNGLTLSAGTAWTEIGDVAFDSGSDTQKGNLSAGFAAKYSFGPTSATLAYDYRHITAAADWKMKQHLGLELGVPLVKLYVGVNQMYPTYGASFDIWLFKITAASYTEELGSQYGQDAERRYLLQTELSFRL